jgi:protein involved in polysaccharide export with SLBB domain
MRATGALLIAACLAASPAFAQRDAGPDTAPTTRAGLEALLAHHEQVAVSPGARRGERESARSEAEAIRRRLEEGDFQVGDRILLVVDGHEDLNDTFTVTAGRVLVLPSIGEIGLGGVLRSELQSALMREVGRYIRNPSLQARPMIRISVLGEVAQPGYYVVSTESLVTDALMLAGGPNARARLDGMRIQRGAERVWDPAELQTAIVEGRTLDQMALRAGDQIVVPPRSVNRFEEFSRVFLWIVPATIGVIGLLTK